MVNTYSRQSMSPILPWKPLLTGTTIDDRAWRVNVAMAGDPGDGEVSVRLRHRSSGREWPLEAPDPEGNPGSFTLSLSPVDGPSSTGATPLPDGRYDVRVAVAGSDGLQDQRLEVPSDVLGEVAHTHLRVGARHLTPYASEAGGLAMAVGRHRAAAGHHLRLDMVRTVAVRDRANKTVRVRLDLQQLPAGTDGHRLRLTNGDRVVTVSGAVGDDGVFEAVVREAQLRGGVWQMTVHVHRYRPWLDIGGSLFVADRRPVAVLYGPPTAPSTVPVHAWENADTTEPTVRAAMGEALVLAGRSTLRHLPGRARTPARTLARRVAQRAHLR